MAAVNPRLQLPENSSALVRKLGAITLLSEDEINFLEGIQNNRIVLQPGVDFVRDGAEFDATFIVRRGWAVRYVVIPDGRRQILGFVLPGDILGLHVNFQRKSTYFASSHTDCEVAMVDPARMLDVSQRHPVLAAGLSWSTVREFSILGNQAMRLGRLTSYERMAHLFLELWYRQTLIGENEEQWMNLPLTQVDLADTLGLSLVHVNRQFRRLRNEGLIETSKRRIRLANVEELTRIAHFNPDHLTGFRL